MKKNLSTFAAALCGVLVGAVAVRAATSDEADERAGRTITYTGYLEENGTPVTGSRDMTFILEGRDTMDVYSRLWPSMGGDSTTTVQVVNGRFSVELGGLGMEALGNPVFTTAETFLSISIGSTPLVGRQRLGTSRHAVHAQTADAFALALDTPPLPDTGIVTPGSGWANTNQTFNLPGPGTFLVLYDATTIRSGGARGDQSNLRLSSGVSGASRARILSGVNDASTGTSGSVALSAVFTSPGADTVTVQVRDSFGGSILIYDAKATVIRIAP